MYSPGGVLSLDPGLILALAAGGTSAALVASQGGLVYSTATALAILAGTATAGQIPRSGANAAPAWSTATYPATMAANRLLYASAADVIAALASANNGCLVTDGSGVPSISSTLPTAVKDNIRETVVTATDTGAVNNWAPGLAGHTLIEWNGASDAAITGLAGGTTGQRVTVKNITTTKVITSAHQSGSSSAGNKFRNAATSGLTPVAAGGWITYQYDGTDWQLVNHEQGPWVTPTYAAGDYTASSGTFTVDAGDVLSNAYVLKGRTLTWAFQLDSASVSATPASLRIKIPGGFTLGPNRVIASLSGNDNGAGAVPCFADFAAGGTLVNVYHNAAASGTWATATNTTGIYGTVTVEVV